MFDPSDKDTIFAIRELRDIVKDQKRPLIFWIGGGVSKWCNYPLWGELAESFHSKYLRNAVNYEKGRAISLLDRGPLPEFFQLCKSTNRALYYQLLAESFGPRPMSPVYSRFLQLLQRNKDLYIVTTNVDEQVEKNLPTVTTLQRPDFERAIDLIQRKQSFLCKLHGTISSLESTVFTMEEYANLLQIKPYEVLISTLFMQATIIFLGYSLGDDYVLNLLQISDTYRPILGSGPHFVVTSKRIPELPTNIRQMKYVSDGRTDHRSALGVLEIIHNAHVSAASVLAAPPQSSAERPASAYYISDFFPPGTWTTSQSAEAAGEDGGVINIVGGTGFVDDEWPVKVSSALHDLTVGLICFDAVYMPSGALGMMHQYLGSELFWLILESGALKFIHSVSDFAVMFHGKSGERVMGGDLGAVNLLNKETRESRSVAEVIKSIIKPVPGKEEKAAKLFEKLENATHVIDIPITSGFIGQTRGALIYPHVRKCLGISDAFLPSNIPRWNVFPVLRLAHIVSVARICSQLCIPAAKIGFGGESLVGITFSIPTTGEPTEGVASYILTGHFNTDLGALVESDPAILGGILKFRETQEGNSLRREVAEMLDTQSGSEFAAAVNGAMKRNLPGSVLEKARNQMSGLLVANPGKQVITPAVWTNIPASDSVLRLWRQRSERQFFEHCRNLRIGPYDLCPCGSSEKRRFCCEEALSG